MIAGCCVSESTLSTSAKFEGTGYIELPKTLLPHTNNKAEEVGITPLVFMEPAYF